MPARAWWALISGRLYILSWLYGRLSRSRIPAGRGRWGTFWAVYFSPNGGAAHAILNTLTLPKHRFGNTVAMPRYQADGLTRELCGIGLAFLSYHWAPPGAILSLLSKCPFLLNHNNLPHHSSPFLPMYPHPWHPLPIPDLGACQYPSPAPGYSHARHLSPPHAV
jgi:hypothetical protein